MELNLYYLNIPLEQPYKLAFGEVSHFDTFIVHYFYNDQHFFGEATALPGYSWEYPDAIWQKIEEWISASSSIKKLINIIQSEAVKYPFAASAPLTAFNKLISPIPFNKCSIPIIGIVSSDDPQIIEDQISNYIQNGHKTIKIKVKGNVLEDLKKIQFIQSIINSDTKLRIDANQGYEFNSCKELFSTLDPTQIELFEQPFKPDKWDEMSTMVRQTSIPLMLDESIWQEQDIIKTAELGCAKYVKLKLFKHCSPENTLNLIELARKNNLEVIFGNGVQSDLGSYDEALIYNHSGLQNDSEINGFLKQTAAIIKEPMLCSDGKIKVTAPPEIDFDILARLTVRSLSVNMNMDIDQA